MGKTVEIVVEIMLKVGLWGVLEVRLFVHGGLRILDCDMNFPLLWFSVSGKLLKS